MSGSHERGIFGRIGPLAAGAWVVLAALFLLGAARDRERLRDLSSSWTRGVEETKGRLAWAAAWEAPSEEERRIWGRAEAAHAAAVPSGETALAFHREVSELALRCGIEGLNLAEIERRTGWDETAGWSDGSSGGDGGDGAWADGGGSDPTEMSTSGNPERGRIRREHEL
ncbi:MAG: hypothetical protein ABIH26_03845, partial [Candidatus Eisenbacteria bacterium]